MGFNFLQRLCVFLVLTIPALSVNWQGTGNMSGSNMTEIQTTISNNPITSATSASQIHTIGQTISTRLNDLWEQAWNVVIVKTLAGYDSVVYGYAYKDHWMWINGVAISGDSSKELAYIIWKDYNCNTWSKINTIFGKVTNLPSDQLAAINAYAFTGLQADIWGKAHIFIEQLSTQFNTVAFSGIFSQDSSALFYGYICYVNGKATIRTQLESQQIGAAFLFWTR